MIGGDAMVKNNKIFLDNITHNKSAYIGSYCLLYWIITTISVVFFSVKIYPDYNEYINIAANNIRSVHQPFAGRLLAPVFAGLIARLGGLNPASVFSFVCAAGWMIVPLPSAAFLWMRKVPLGWALIAASVPFPALAARFFQVPDAWPICLALTIFIAIELNRGLLAGASAFGLALTRTSSALAVALRLVVRGEKRRLGMVLVLILAFSAGVLLKAPITQQSAGNQHKMSGALYLLAKTPVNGLANIFGVHLYANTFPYCPRPTSTLNLSKTPGLGDITTVGLCAMDYKPVIVSATCYLFIFGVIPFWTVSRLIKNRRSPRRGAGGTWRELAVFLAAFLLSPTFGLTIPRLFVESYPLMFLAMANLAPSHNPSASRAAGLMLYNLCGLAIIMTISPN